MSLDTPRELERNHVYKVYESIADHFSETRHWCWPKVSEYLNSLESGSLVLDVGCGNGKYHVVNNGILLMGCDISEQLLHICATRSMNVFQAEALHLPIRDESVDHLISIAVIHHLASAERRLDSVREMVRVLRPGGSALIYVWALEQEHKDGKPTRYVKKEASEEVASYLGLPIHVNRTKFRSQDVFVPWKSKTQEQTFLRFYHVFKENELEDLCTQLSGVTVIDRYFDQGNWALVVRKNK